MPEETAVLHILAHEFNDAEIDTLAEIMDEHEFWYWEETPLQDSGKAIISHAFVDSDDNADKLDDLVAVLRNEFTPEEIEISKRDADRPGSLDVPTAFVYVLDIEK